MAISVQSGFQIGNIDPVDARLSVADESARLGFASDNVYEGLTVYQKDTNELFVLIDANYPDTGSSWRKVNVSDDIVQLSNISQSNDISYEERSNKLVIYVSSSESFLVNSSNLSTTVFETGSDGTTTTNFLTTTNALLPFVGSNF